ncbi:hypothetical protein HPG69_019445 [Diceros bicornis minor]|uniref:Uncharacterized protein n=1 Tax=Diceros bicornis minor TaxID=77932 RepID=A0A7J7F0T1_DICBM|nr:hypothetical protein HPG69_019445 [Diceros bicornis minor]
MSSSHGRKEGPAWSIVAPQGEGTWPRGACPGLWAIVQKVSKGSSGPSIVQKSLLGRDVGADGESGPGRSLVPGVVHVLTALLILPSSEKALPGLGTQEAKMHRWIYKGIPPQVRGQCGLSCWLLRKWRWRMKEYMRRASPNPSCCTAAGPRRKWQHADVYTPIWSRIRAPRLPAQLPTNSTYASDSPIPFLNLLPITQPDASRYRLTLKN